MVAFATFALIVFFFTILVLIGKANEQSEDLAGKGMNYDNKSKWNGYFMLSFVIIFFISIVYQVKLLAPIMIPKSASVHGDQTDNLFYVTLFFMTIVFVLTQAALFYFAYRYNQGINKEAYFYSHNNKLEVIWTVIPAIVLAVLVVMGMRVWFSIFDQDSRDKNAMVIEVTAKQFQWMARYPGTDGKFGTRIIDKEHITPTNELGIDFTKPESHDDFFADKLVFIKNKPVLVKLGALDVIHSFYLPHFRVKMDCVPGIPTQFYFVPKYTTEEMRQYLQTQPWWCTINPETGEPRWKTFKYELACTEICGRSHYGMQKEVVVVKDEAAYQEWVKTQTAIYKPGDEGQAKPATEVPTASTGDAFETKLSTGVAINGAKDGVEAKLIAFIEDATKQVDKTTWFSFDRLTFETGKATLKESSKAQLQNIVEIMKAFPDVNLKLGGYTDNVGDKAANLKLSDERAKSVIAELVKMGVDASKLAAEGYGEQFPVASNDTEEGRAKNRRIDVRVTKKPAPSAMSKTKKTNTVLSEITGGTLHKSTKK